VAKAIDTLCEQATVMQRRIDELERRLAEAEAREVADHPARAGKTGS